MRVNRTPEHYGRVCARVRAVFTEVYRPGAEATERRVEEIAALSRKDWKGVTVFQVRCQGDFGKGPHDVWVPEYLLWGLISPRRFYCAFHR